MKTDYKIIEQIRQYYADELSNTDARKLEILMDTDEQYIYHNRLFRTLSEGIGQAHSSNEWITDIKKESEGMESEVIDSLKKNDNRHTRIRQFLFLLSILIIIAGLVYFFTNALAKESTSNSDPTHPMAEESTVEENEPIGGTGTTIFREIPVLSFQENTDTYADTGKKQSLSIRKNQGANSHYVYQNDRLVLYLDEYERFETIRIELLEKGEQTYLRLEGEVYAIVSGTIEPMELGEAVLLE